MTENREDIGLAIVGCGTVGRIRGMFAKEYPGVGWIGLCDMNEELGEELAEDTDADFFTTDSKELMQRPEVNAAIIATDENHHAEPAIQAAEQGHSLFIEKPLATTAQESADVLQAIRDAGVDAVVGYTQRFRRRFLATKAKLEDGALGEVNTVVTRAFMNRMVPLATVRRTSEKEVLTPMVVSGTHSLDASMWMLEGKSPVSVYAQSVDDVLGDKGTKDSTLGVFTMDDGTIFSMSISWALPEEWPGAVYGLQVGIVGSEGAMDIEDTHRDLVLASKEDQWSGYNPEGFEPGFTRNVEFLGSYPPGDLYRGDLWGPMREETQSWFRRIYLGEETPHASAYDGHRNLLLTKSMDLAAKRGERLDLPTDIDEYDLEALDNAV
ncbi:MAG: Gfo/Idh/MocA family protein [Halobacteriota archaeon]